MKIELLDRIEIYKSIRSMTGNVPDRIFLTTEEQDELRGIFGSVPLDEKDEPEVGSLPHIRGMKIVTRS